MEQAVPTPVEPRAFRCRGAGGVELVGDAFGDPQCEPVVLLHGGGQTRHAWGNTARVVAEAGYYAIALDHRGHGDSGWPQQEDYGLDRFAEDVIEVALALGRAPVVVGASLGGLAGLMAEGEHGPVLRALVLVDVAPRLEPKGVMRIISFMESGLDGFDSLDAAADAIASYLPHRQRPKDLDGLAKNLRQREDGRWHWHWDPRFVRRTNGDPAYNAERLSGAARALTLPTLLVRGRMSDVVSEESVAEFRALVPHADFVDVKGARHMVAGDKNDVFAASVLEFLRGLT